MAGDKDTKAPEPLDRRRFLRQSAKGAVPYLATLVGAGKLAGQPAAPQKSPPPAADDAAPEDARKELDRHKQRFSDENPGLDSIEDILSRE